MRVAVFSTKYYDRDFLNPANIEERHTFTYFEAALDSNTANLTKGFDAVCIFVNDRVDAETVEKMAENNVRLIVLRCAGFNNVDIEAAERLGIPVMRVPAYSPHAVAEHAVSLILTLDRKTHKAYNRIRESNFSLERLMGFNLYGKTVGVVGTGKIGIAFCEIMLGFGCKVLAYDTFPSEQLAAKGVRYTSLDEVISQSDIISLHCPLTKDTFHLINSDTLGKMKKGAMLINTSRGAVIETNAVVEALKNERLGYLGIDVYEQEESLFFRDLSESIVPDDVIARLISFPNVLITAHQGFFTREAMAQIAQTTIQNLTDFESGNVSANEVKAGKQAQIS